MLTKIIVFFELGRCCMKNIRVANNVLPNNAILQVKNYCKPMFG